MRSIKGFKQKKNHSFLINLSLVVVIIVVFFIYLQYENKRQNEFSVNPKTFLSLQSMSSYMKKEYRDYPDLEIAQDYNQITKSVETIPIPKWNRNLQFDKVWVSDQGIFLVYSFNILKTDKNLHDIPELSIDNVSLNIENGKNIKITSVQPADIENEHAIGHRVYQTMIIHLNIPNTFEYNPDAKGVTKRKKVIQQLNHLTGITIGKLECSLKNGNDPVELSPVTLKSQYTSSNKVLKSIPLHQSITFDGNQVNFTKAEITIEGIQLTLKTKSQKKVSMLTFKQQDGQNGKYAFMRSDILANNKFYLGFPQKWPYIVTLTPIRYSVQDKSSFRAIISSSVINSMLSGIKESAERKIGTIQGVSLYLGMEKPTSPDLAQIQLNPGQIALYIRTSASGSNRLDLTLLQLKHPGQGFIGYGPVSYMSWLSIDKAHHLPFKQMGEMGIIDNKRLFVVNKNELQTSGGIELTINPVFINHKITDIKSIKLKVKK